MGNLPGITNRCYDLGWEKPVITISNFSRVVDFKEIDRTLQNTPEEILLFRQVEDLYQEKVLIRSLKQSQSSLM